MSVPVYPPINVVVSKTEYAVDNAILEDRITNIEGMTLSNSAAISNLAPYVSPLNIRATGGTAEINFRPAEGDEVPFTFFDGHNVNLSNVSNINGSAYPPAAAASASLIGLNAWLAPYEFVMTAADMGKSYACMPNDPLTIRLPNPNLLPTGTSVSFTNCMTGYAATQMSILYTSGSGGIGLGAGYTMTLSCRGNRYYYMLTAVGTAGSLIWT